MTAELNKAPQAVVGAPSDAPFRERFADAYLSLSVAHFNGPFWNQSMEELLVAVDAEIDKRAADRAQQAGAAAPSVREFLQQLSQCSGGMVNGNRLASRAKELLAATPQPQGAGMQVASDLLNADELAALRRFDECAQDGEGYDVPKAMMRRLSEIGVVQRLSGAYYHVTEFGQRVLGNAPAATTPKDQGAGMQGASIERQLKAARGLADERFNELLEANATIDDLRAQLARQGQGEPVAEVDAGEDGLFVEIIYGPDGSPLKVGDKLYLASPAQASAAPADGWKLVPAKPTDDMIVAFAEQWYSKVRCIDDCEMEDCYAAMLAASPEPATAAVPDQKSTDTPLTAGELAFIEIVRKFPGHKLNSGESRSADGTALWVRPQALGLIQAVGSYKWIVPGAKAQNPVADAVAAAQPVEQPADDARDAARYRYIASSPAGTIRLDFMEWVPSYINWNRERPLGPLVDAAMQASKGATDGAVGGAE